MLHIRQKDNILEYSYFNESGKVEIEQIRLEPYELFEWRYDKFSKNKNDAVQSWDNKPVKKQSVKRLSKFRIFEIMKNRGILEKHKKYNIPKIYFCDIETEFVEGMTSPDLALHQVLTITLVTESEQIISFGLRELSDIDKKKIENDVNIYFKGKKKSEGVKFSYFYFENEYDMLYTFFSKFLKKIDCITGWYFLDYDWKYLVNRCKRLNIDSSICSPTNEYFNPELKTPLHKLVFDYLEIFAKWDKSIEVLENNSLDLVSNELLQLGKIKYQGSLMDLYNRDFVKYLYYNIVDTFIVKLINDKVRTIEIYVKLAETAQAPIQKSLSPVYMTELFFLDGFLSKNRVYPKEYTINDNDIENEEKKSYDGGYVMEPTPGNYKWSVCYDLSSMYPTTEMEFCISPETKVVENEGIPENQLITCVTGVKFNKNVKSPVLPTIIKKLFRERKEIQKQWKSKLLEIEEKKKRLEYLKTLKNTEA